MAWDISTSARYYLLVIVQINNMSALWVRLRLDQETYIYTWTAPIFSIIVKFLYIVSPGGVSHQWQQLWCGSNNYARYSIGDLCYGRRAFSEIKVVGDRSGRVRLKYNHRRKHSVRRVDLFLIHLLRPHPIHIEKRDRWLSSSFKVHGNGSAALYAALGATASSGGEQGVLDRENWWFRGPSGGAWCRWRPAYGKKGASGEAVATAEGRVHGGVQ